MRKQPSASPTTLAHAKDAGRPYGFVVTLLATFVVGLTFSAVWPAATVSTPAATSPATTATATAQVAQRPTRPLTVARPVTRDRLRHVGGIALGVAILSLVPSRRRPDDGNLLTPQLVAQTTGLPILGSLFSSQTTPSKSSSRSGWLIRTLVSTSEMLLCTAFMLTLAACFTKPDLWTVLRQNPLNGYVTAVAHLFDTVQAWLHPGVTLT